MKAEQIAISAFSTADVPLEEVCAAYAAAGFRNVEFPLLRLRDYLAPRIKQLLAQHGLRCIAGLQSHVSCFGDWTALALSQSEVTANAKLLAGLGGGVLVVGTDGPGSDAAEKSFVALDAVGRTLFDLADKIPPSVSLAVEFNRSPIVKSLRSAKIVCDAANHARVGILFDTAHYHCTASKFEDLTPAVVAKILHVHVSNMRDLPGELCNGQADRVLPGSPDGVLDLRAIITRMESLGYRGYFALEMFSEELCRLPIAEASRRCYDAMQTLL